jgi:hypothetical protein
MAGEIFERGGRSASVKVEQKHPLAFLDDKGIHI